MKLLKTIFGSSENRGRITHVTSAEAKNRLNSSHPPFILDVRQPNEFQSGHIMGAKLIPLGELSARMDEVPKDTEILCVCRSGGRSSAAARQLSAAGYNVLNLDGGMMAWQSAGYPVKKLK